MFKGKKTYIISVLLVVVTSAKTLGFIDENLYMALIALLNAGGLASLRSSIS